MKKEVTKTAPVAKGILMDSKNSLLNIQQQRIFLYACSLFDKEHPDQPVIFSLDDYKKVFHIKYNREVNNIISTLDGIMNLKLWEVSNDNKGKVIPWSVIKGNDDTPNTYYENGYFYIKFNPKYANEIYTTGKQFFEFGLSLASDWNCKYTHLLYAYLKQNYTINEIEISLDNFRNLFKLDKKEYTDNKDFKNRVWNKAVNEINNTTGYNISVTPSGRGKKTVYVLTVIDREELKVIDNKPVTSSPVTEDPPAEEKAATSIDQPNTSDNEYTEEKMKELLAKVESGNKVVKKEVDPIVIEETPKDNLILEKEQKHLEFEKAFMKQYGFPYIPTLEQYRQAFNEDISESIYDKHKYDRRMINVYFKKINESK